MKLTGPETQFELDILDYEYSDSPDFLDRNWLLISLKTQYKNKRSTTTAPLLSTWEIELLINWMRSLETDEQLAPRLTFVEPCLGFCRAPTHPDSYAFRIKLEQEATPDWYTDDSEPFWLSVTIDRQGLKRAISDLERQLRQFPVRK